MDPVTHALAARLAASLGRAPLPRSAALLSVAAGLAPDLDAIFMPVGWDVYLRVHEAGTHSLAGGAILAAVIASLWRPFTVLPYRPLLVTASIAVLTHILLDVVSGATVRIGWPVVPGRTTIGLVAMADPWLAAPFALGVLLALAARSRIERIAPVTALLVAVLLGAKLVSRQLALVEYRTVGDRAATTAEAQAQWSSLTRWWIYETTTDRLRLWNVDGWHGTAVLVLDRERGVPRQMIHGEAGLTTVRNFRLAHHLPVRVSTTTEGITRVFWSDLRFCFAPDPGSGPMSGSRLRPAADPIACGVWFGGELDTGGRIVRQFVTIGSFVQER